MSDRTPADAFLASADLQDLGGLAEFVAPGALPAATSFATFAGLHDQAIGRVAGPDTAGRWHTAVTAEYDMGADQTRIGFAAGIHVGEICPACKHPAERHLGRWCRVPTGAVNAAGQALICCCEAVDAAEATR